MINVPRYRRFSDHLLGSFGGLAAGVTIVVLLLIIGDLLRLGFPSITREFLAGEVKEGGRSGGIGPVLLSTIWIVSLCLLVAIPLSLGCAVWLSEFVPRGSFPARCITGAVDLLASVPSIVFGLFGMTFFCQFLGLGFSILSGGLTLACMTLPLLVRTTLSSLQGLPADYRPAAAALGMTQTTTLRTILLPAALPGIVVGVTLGIGRALAETAALIFTSGYATRWPGSPGDSGRALSVHIYDLAMNVPGGGSSAAASALVLLFLILIINGLAVFLAGTWHSRFLNS